jgi:hypothetical protein
MSFFIDAIGTSVALQPLGDATARAARECRGVCLIRLHTPSFTQSKDRSFGKAMIDELFGELFEWTDRPVRDCQ